MKNNLNTLNKNLFYCGIFAAFLFSCRHKEEKKADFENDKYIHIMGPLKDTAIGNSGFRMLLPGLYRIDETSGEGFTEYKIHPSDPTHNKSSIRFHIGEHADTADPAGRFSKIGPVVNGDWTSVQYISGDTMIRRDYWDDWAGKKVMMEEITTNKVELFDLQKVIMSFHPDTTRTTR